MTLPRFRLQPAADVRLAGLLALGAFLLLLLSGRSLDLLGSPARIGLVLAWAPVAVAFWISGRAAIVAAYVVAGGLFLRWIELPPGGRGPSDHLAATYEAIDVTLAGGNPYDHVYQLTRPVGSPVSQPPGELLVHLPGFLLGGLAGVQLTQLLLAALAMGIFLALGLAVSWMASLPALAVYAGAPNLVLLATDGSNDTGTGALLLLAAVVLALAVGRATGWQLALAGALLAIALATKQVTLPVGVALVAWLLRSVPWHAGRAYLAGGAGVLLALSLPFLLMGPATYLAGLLGFVGAHEDVYGWNIWALAQGLGLAPWPTGPAAALNAACSVAAVLVLAALPYRSLAGALLAGCTGLLVVLLTARWTTYAYFGMVAPLVLALPALVAWEGRRDARPSPA